MAKKKKNAVQRDPCTRLADGKNKCKQSWCKNDCGYCKVHCNGDCKKKKGVDAPKSRLASRDLSRPPCGPSTCTSQRYLCNSGSGYCERHCPCQNCCVDTRTVAPPTIPRSKRPAGSPPIYTDVLTDDEKSSDEDEKKESSDRDDRKVESVNDLIQAFSLTRTTHNLPSEKKRSQSDVAEVIKASLNGRQKIQTMVSLALQVLEESVKIICPGDPDFLLNEVKEKLVR
jgi:hypothetical protein